MIEYENIIYLDVYRTGSTSMINLLEKIMDEPLVQTYRHAALTKGRRHGRTGGKLVITTVRNPWDWYVSLWGHGADGKSAIRKYLSQHFDTTQIARLYDQTTPVEAFRHWIKIVHDPFVLDRIMREHYPESGLSSIIGLYTYRFLRVTTRYPRLFLRRWFLRSTAGVNSFHRKLKAYNQVLRNETLNADLIGLVHQHAGRCRFNPLAEQLIQSSAVQRLNKSSRRFDDYRAYYDGETKELVANRDRFFILEFGYTF